MSEQTAMPPEPAVNAGRETQPAATPDHPSIAALVEALPDIGDPAFAGAFDRFAGARVVLLGESSHGTSEFHLARAAITRRLIERHGFTMVAIEANWADASCMDAYVRRRPRSAAEPAFRQFPSWMWRNEETAMFLAWLRDWNGTRGPAGQTSMLGLDVRNVGAAIRAAFSFLARRRRLAPEAIEAAYAGFGPLLASPERYCSVEDAVSHACREAAQALHHDILAMRPPGSHVEDDDWFDAAMAACVVANAEAFYRLAPPDFARRWNTRETHMHEALTRFLRTAGESAKAVVWAHNSHVGNHAYNEFGQQSGMHSLGQLLKDQLGNDAVAIGFGTHEGTFAAACEPNGPLAVQELLPAKPGSWDRICHEAGHERFLLDMRAPTPLLLETRPHRGFGAVNPADGDGESNYYDAVLGKQYDAWVWFETSHALRPLGNVDNEPEWPMAPGRMCQSVKR